MNQSEKLERINELLLEDQPQYSEDARNFPKDYDSQRRLMRSLMNVRYPRIVPAELLKLQDEFLSEESIEKGIIEIDSLPTTKRDDRLIIWQGDITRLAADAIVNAANSQMLGCFAPCHGCIDNAIHSAAGLGLRQECAEIMERQGHEEPTGKAKITGAYNLPARHVIHTVGPIIYGSLTKEDEELLASCYSSCMALADEYGLGSIAFCCISTGEFHFPNERAAEIAVATVQEYLDTHPDTRLQKIIFNVFKDIDREIYNKLLD